MCCLYYFLFKIRDNNVPHVSVAILASHNLYPNSNDVILDRLPEELAAISLICEKLKAMVKAIIESTIPIFFFFIICNIANK